MPNKICHVCMWYSTINFIPFLPIRGFCEHSKKYYSNESSYKYSKFGLFVLVGSTVAALIDLALNAYVSRSECDNDLHSCLLITYDIFFGFDTLIAMVVLFLKQEVIFSGMNGRRILYEDSPNYPISTLALEKSCNKTKKTLTRYRILIYGAQLFSSFLEIIYIVRMDTKPYAVLMKLPSFAAILAHPCFFFIIAHCKSEFLAITKVLHDDVRAYMIERLQRHHSEEIHEKLVKYNNYLMKQYKVYGAFYLFLNPAYIICIAVGEITLIINVFLLTITTPDGAHGWEIFIVTCRTIFGVYFLVGGTVWLDMTKVVS